MIVMWRLHFQSEFPASFICLLTMAGHLNEALQKQLVEASKIVEQQVRSCTPQSSILKYLHENIDFLIFRHFNSVDAEIHRLDNLDENDYEVLRQKRLDQLKKAQSQKQEWLSTGHGRYEEIPDEKAFFETTKHSKRVVCHFYREATERCKIVDKHLNLLAQKHVETRFVKIDAEKSKFLVERLRIVVLPTICLVREGKTVDYVVGFDDLGGTDEFTTEQMEWRLARADVINYEGDLMNMPGTAAAQAAKKASVLHGGKKHKIIRDDGNTPSDDDDDW